MKRIKVPEGMLKAAQIEQKQIIYKETDEEFVRRCLHAALLWLSNHPPVPTDEQVKELAEACGVPIPDDFLVREGIKEFAKEWQHRCFQEEEPDIPDIPEEIKDLLWAEGHPDSRFHLSPQYLNKQLIEAYRRGTDEREERRVMKASVCRTCGKEITKERVPPQYGGRAWRWKTAIGFYCPKSGYHGWHEPAPPSPSHKESNDDAAK